MILERFIDLVMTNSRNVEILRRLPALGVADAWLVGGCVFQTVWNALTNRPPDFGILDWDVFYFDVDLSSEAEERIAERAAGLFADLDVRVELRNQARVHLWYAAEFGMAYPPLSRTTQGIDRFLVRASMVGVRRTESGCEVYAPHGFDDIASMVLRPNRTPNFSAALYAQKAGRWSRMWPELKVIAAGP